MIDVLVISILEDMFVNYECMKFNLTFIGVENEPDNIKLLLDIFDFIQSKSDLIYSIGVIKYVFIELEETLKHYNLYS